MDSATAAPGTDVLTRRFALALVAAAALPLMTWFYMPDRAAVVDMAGVFVGIAGLVAALALVFAPKPQQMRVGLVGLAWVSFLVIAFVSMLASGRGWSAFMGEPTNLLGWGTIVVLTVIAWASGVFGGALRGLLDRYAWIVLLAESVVALAQLAAKTQAVGTLPNSTYFGVMALLLLPFTLEGVDAEGDYARWGRYAAVALTIVALAATGSRIALLVALAWAVYVLFKMFELDTTKKILIIAGLVVVVVLVSLVFVRGELLTTFTGSALGDRPGMWRMTVEAIKSRPLLGWGPDGFMDGAAAISTPELGRVMQLQVLQPGNTDPHDLVLWIAVSTGVLGLVAALAFLASAIVTWVHHRGSRINLSPAVWGVCGSLVLFLLAPIPLQVAALFALVFGVSLQRTPTGDEPKASVPVAPTASMLVGAALALLCLVYVANLSTRVRFEVPSPERSPMRADAAQSSADLWSFDPYLSYLASMHWGYAALADPNRANFVRDEALARRAATLDKRNPFFGTVPVRVLVSYGAPADKIEAAFNESFARYPVNPFARAPYAAMLAGQGRIEEAKEQLAIAELPTDEGNEERLALIQSARDAIAQAEAGQKTP